MVHITKAGQKTVIITTHYIEEARQAHTVSIIFVVNFVLNKILNKFATNIQIGLMRSGRLLAEESPQVLLSMYRCSSLEDVFLKLSRKQGQAQQASELNIRYFIVYQALCKIR